MFTKLHDSMFGSPVPPTAPVGVRHAAAGHRQPAPPQTSFDQLFDQIDSNGRGVITKEEFMAAVSNGVLPQHMEQRRMTHQPQERIVDSAELFRNFDFNEDGQVSRSEYLEGMRYIHAGGPIGSLVFGDHTLGAPHLPQAAAHALAQGGYAASATAGGWDGGAGVANVMDDQGNGGVGGKSGRRGPGAGSRSGPGGGAGNPGSFGPGGASRLGSGGGGGFGPGHDGVITRDSHDPEIQTRPVIRVPLPQSNIPGGKRFFGSVPAELATFAYSELCATEEPECSLAPVPDIAEKRWYNTYLYYPEERRAIKDGGQFMERFVQGPNGEWLDIPKARRMADYIKEKREHQEQQKEEMRELLAGASWGNTGLEEGAEGASAEGALGTEHGIGASGGTTGGRRATHQGGVGKTVYSDPYSAERLVAFEGRLQPMSELLKEHGVRQPMLQQAESGLGEMDFDNLRAPWPGGRPYRNKKISNNVYEWYDRRSPYQTSDESFKILELPSIFVDREDYEKWEELGDKTMTQFTRDEFRELRQGAGQFERSVEARAAA